MATKKDRKDSSRTKNGNHLSSSVEELLIAALKRGDESLQTGRYIVTFKEGAGEEALKSLEKTQGMRIANARDFEEQAATLESVGDADAVVFPEIGVAVVGGDAAQERSMGIQSANAADSPIESIDPEYFVFAENSYNQYVQGSNFKGAAENNAFEGLPDFARPMQQTSSEYLRGFLRAAEIIARDLQQNKGYTQIEAEEAPQVVGATWGLIACKVPPSVPSGTGIKVALLTNGFDLGHPDFVGRPVVGQTFVGQPVQDLSGHGTHMTGTACGPETPAGSTPRYGISFRSSIFVGKVLNNSMSGTMSTVLAGMNWAIANRCAVIYTSAGSASPVSPAYTAAGQAALNNGCLIIAGAGSSGSGVGAPANSPTIMSVGAVTQNLQPTPFSPLGKIDIVAPAVNIFSSWVRPLRYNTISGTATAGAHGAGCAALWAETSPTMRGLTLWRKLAPTARPLPFPATRVGAGLVQAPHKNQVHQHPSM
jgi:subtilisin family serine protease